MTRLPSKKRKPLAFGLGAGLLLCMALLPAEVQARPAFHGGGAHFNVGPHFNGGHPHPGHHPDHHPHPGPPPNHHHHDHHYDHHHPPHYWPGGYWAGVATGAAVGAVIYSLPPACTTLVVNGITYRRCSSTWYRPVYSGNQVVYEVVAPPR